MHRPEEYVPGKIYVLVTDTVKAFGDLARYYRSRFSIPVIGVTGSVGKTTTKDMTAAVLSEKFRVLKTQANHNNQIGLPETVFHIDHSTEIAVLEMGMNHPGEIDYLVHIAQPTAVTITNIGDAHIGLLGSRENIFRAKCEIFGGLQKNGFAVLNADDEYLPRLRDRRAAGEIFQGTNPAEGFKLLWVGESAEADLHAEDIDDGYPDRMNFTAVWTADGRTSRLPVEVPAPGHHMIYPVLTAAAFGMRYGLSPEEIARGVQGYVPTGMRMETKQAGEHILIFNDTYNANPQSVKAGLRTLADTAGCRHVAVLGDMFELGEMEEKLHREIGRFAAELGRNKGTGTIDVLITVGRAAEWTAEEARACGLAEVYACRDKAEAKEILPTQIRPDTAFLVKASRGMALEELTDFIETAADHRM